MRKQLTKIPQKSANTFLPKAANFSQTQEVAARKSDKEALALEVAALDNFKVPVQNRRLVT